MKKICFQTILLLILLIQSSTAQTINVNWAFESYLRPSFQTLAVSENGDLFLAGTITGSIDADPGPGQVILTPGSIRNGYVCKFAASGKLIWAQTYGGSGDLSLHVITVDSSGSVFIAGSFSLAADLDPGPATYTISTPGKATFIAKLNTNGTPLWSYVADQGPVVATPQHDVVRGIAIDKYGNVCATGEFQTTTDFAPGPATQSLSSQGAQDVFILRLGSGGAFQWVRAIGSPTRELSSGIHCMDDGSIFVTGRLEGVTDLDPNAGVYTVNVPPLNTFVMSLDSAANFNWATALGSTNSSAHAITGTPSGNVLICGSFNGVADFDPGPSTQTLGSQYNAGYIWELSANGNFISALNFPASLGQSSVIDISTDKFGNIYTSGTFMGIIDLDPTSGVFTAVSSYSQIQQAFLAKYTSTGNLLWGGALESQQMIAAMNVAVDPEATYIYSNGLFSGLIDVNPGPVTYTLNSLYPQYPVSAAYLEVLCQGTPQLSSAITGPSVICQGQNSSYSINPALGALRYSWTVPSCMTGNSDSLIINTTAAAVCNGSLSVVAQNACGTSSITTKYVEVSACTGITESETGPYFNPYPNPSAGNFYFENVIGRNFVLRISDNQGRILQALEFSGKEEICAFRIPDKGAYLCEIMVNATSIAKKKIIVVHP